MFCKNDNGAVFVKNIMLFEININERKIRFISVLTNVCKCFVWLVCIFVFVSI